MNALKRMNKEIEVYIAIYVDISGKGYFGNHRFTIWDVSQACQVSQSFVKRIYWKKFVPENKKFLDSLECW